MNTALRSRSGILSLLVFGFLVAAAPSLLDAREAGQQPDEIFVEGRVVNAETGQPLEGVDLDLTDSREPTPPLYAYSESPPAATSDAEGRFRISGLRPGRYEVAPVLAGFVYARPDRLEAPGRTGVWIQVDGESVTGIEIPMVREAVITGELFGADGRPMESPPSLHLARYIYSDSGQRHLDRVPGTSTVRPDDRGQYRFYGLQPGEYFLRSGGAEKLGRPVIYYPGTSDKVRALPVRIGPGDEVRLNVMTVVDAERTEVRLRLSNVVTRQELFSLGPTITFGEGGGIVSLVSRGDGGEAGGSREIVIPMAQGHYDGVATWDGPDGLSYSPFSLDVGSTSVEREVPGSGPPVRVTGSLTYEHDDAGDTAAAGIRCRLQSELYWTHSTMQEPTCFGQDLVPGEYALELVNLPPDAYVVSATAGAADFLSGSVDISANIDLEIVLASPGGEIEGLVTNDAGEILSQAVVALVPDPPRRDVGLLYRSVVSDVGGRFRLRGIRPGAYELFAWEELEGAAYRNVEFMEEFNGRGVPIRIEMPTDRTRVDLTAF